MAQQLNIGLPEALDLAPGYTLRVTALDPTTGSLVAGVNVGTVVITAEAGGGVGAGGSAPGEWFLVPGASA